MGMLLRYELKKIFSLPTLVLLAVAACVLALAPLSRRHNFEMRHGGLSPEAYRLLSEEYAGPLDEALAARALGDYRALPDDDGWDGTTDENIARRSLLEQIAAEYAAAGSEAAADTGGMSWDAARRVDAITESWAAPPARHGYYEGWTAFRDALDAEAPFMCALLAVFSLSPLYAGETASGMAPLCRTCRHGRWAHAIAKILSAALFSLLCAALCALLPLALCAALFGLRGGGLPAEYLGAAYPLTIAEYAAARIIFLLLGGVAMGAVTATLSPAMPATAAALAGAAVFLAPVLYRMTGVPSPLLDTLMRYAPSSLLMPGPLLEGISPAMLFSSAALWQPQWLCLLWGALTPALWAASGRLYLRTLREEPPIEE